MALDLKQTRFLQPLRSNTVHSTVKAAIEDIQAIQSTLATTTHSDGISVVARYWSVYNTETQTGSNAKSVLGIYSQKTDSFTYFVHDYDTIEKVIERVSNLEKLVGEKSISEQITEAITAELAKLDVDAIGGNGKLVTTVSQTDGRISAEVIDATAANIAVKDDSNLFTADNVEGVLVEIDTAYKAADVNLQKAIDALETAIGEGGSVTTQITNAINELNSEKTGDGTFVDVTVKQEKGVITSVVVAENDIASASALTKEITDRETAISNLLGSVEENDAKTIAALNDRIDTVSGAAKSYEITALSIDELNALSNSNVKEAWKLIDEDGKQAGSTILNYKDSSLKEVKLVGQELQFTYILANGNESTVGVDVSNFLAESEFSNGLQVVDHIVSVKLDATSESFLTVSKYGVKLSGVQDAIDVAVAAEASAITAAIADEESARSAADSALDGRIDALETAIGEGGSVTTQITNAINELNSEKTGDGTFVDVTVKQEKGVITSVVVAENDIASASALTKEISDRTDADTALGERIDNIVNDKTFVKEITVNGVLAAIADNKATVTIEGDNIAVSSEYGNSVTYPTLSNTAVTFTAVEGTDTIDNAIKTLDQNIATLVQEVLNNETTVAAALTKLNESCGFNENAEYIVNTAATYINSASNLAEADNLLDAAISNLQTQIDNVNDAAISVVSGNGISVTGDSTEKTIAAVAKADDSLITVTENGIGIKDDGYIDCGTFGD